MSSLRSLVRDALLALDGVVESSSGFSHADAYWVNGKEIAHFETDDVIELRLTRAEIRARRAALRADPRVKLRASSSADWLEVEFAAPEDVGFVAGLASVAADAHRAAVGGAVVEPPTGAALARRRRFH